MTESSRGTVRTLIDLGADAPVLQPVDLAERPTVPAPEEVVAAATRQLDGDQSVLTAELPGNVALLCVMRGDSDRFTMSWHDGRSIREAQKQMPADGRKSIAHFMDRARKAAETKTGKPENPLIGGPWQQAYKELVYHWNELHELGGWVRDYRASAASAPHLVIWDVTGYDTPWELYYGAVGKGTDGVFERGWLGVTLPVSRWIGDTPSLDEIRSGGRDAVGGLLLFDDGKAHEEQERPRYKDVYKKFESVRVGELEVSMQELLVRLEVEDFGLLLIRGHGVFAEDLRSFALAGLPLLALADRDLAALGRNRPAVLLSLCSSGRTYVDGTAPSRPVRSFVEPFIERGASTVIAILADIDVTHLHEVALDLVEAAIADAVTVPEWLRGHRADYFAQLKHAIDIGKEDLYRMFLTSCLYVCYCHPATTLRITSKIAQGYMPDVVENPRTPTSGDGMATGLPLGGAP